MAFSYSILGWLVICALILLLLWVIYNNIRVTLKLIKSPVFDRTRKIVVLVLIWILPALGAIIAEHLIEPSDGSPSDRYMGQSVDEAMRKGHHKGL